MKKGTKFPKAIRVFLPETQFLFFYSNSNKQTEGKPNIPERFSGARKLCATVGPGSQKAKRASPW